MRVSEELLMCVTFLYAFRPEEPVEAATPRATAFYIGAPVGESTGSYYQAYVVTARHVVNEARAAGLSLFVRMALPDGSTSDEPIPVDKWHLHPRSDVAMAPIFLKSDRAARCLRAGNLMRMESARAVGVGAGDELVAIGLYANRPGRERPLPIARFGHLSRMPDEPIPLKVDSVTRSSPVDVYLADLASWGGQSGAPVFIHVSTSRIPGQLIWTAATGVSLLGLLHGHEEVLAPVLEVRDGTRSRLEGEIALNAGISVVVPADHILDLLNDPVVVEERELAHLEVLRASADIT